MRLERQLVSVGAILYGIALFSSNKRRLWLIPVGRPCRAKRKTPGSGAEPQRNNDRLYAIEATSQFHNFHGIPGSETPTNPIQLPVAFRVITEHLSPFAGGMLSSFDRQLSPRMTGICVFTDRNHVPPALFLQFQIQRPCCSAVRILPLI